VYEKETCLTYLFSLTGVDSCSYVITRFFFLE
jgi:hypothetical protein